MHRQQLIAPAQSVSSLRGTSLTGRVPRKERAVNARMQMHGYCNPVQARWWHQSACGASETSQAVDPQTSTSPHLPSRALELRRPLVHILICQRHRLALRQVFEKEARRWATQPNGGMKAALRCLAALEDASGISRGIAPLPVNHQARGRGAEQRGAPRAAPAAAAARRLHRRAGRACRSCRSGAAVLADEGGAPGPRSSRCCQVQARAVPSRAGRPPANVRSLRWYC